MFSRGKIWPDNWHSQPDNVQCIVVISTSVEVSEDITKPHRDKKQNQKPNEFDSHSLKSMPYDLTTLGINLIKKDTFFQTQLSKLDLPGRCQNCIRTGALKCKHYFHCGLAEHLQTGCLKR